MKIAFFVHRYDPVQGGAERYIKHTAEYCASHGHTVTVHTTNALLLQSFLRNEASRLAVDTRTVYGVTVVRHRIVYPPLRRYWGNLAFKTGVARGMMRGYIHPATPIVPSMRQIKERYDLIVSTALPYDFINLAAYRLSRRLSVPVVMVPFIHLGDMSDPNDAVRPYYTQKYQLDLLRKAHGVIVQTDFEKDFLLRHSVAGSSIAVVGQGIDSNDYCVGPARSLRDRLGIPAEAFVIGHLGNLSFEKGSLDLLDVYNSIAGKGGIYLLYAGSAMDSYNTYISGKTMPQTFRYLGVIDDTTRNEFFSAIDCFCLPSRVESFGVAFLESWLFGKPVIAYDAGSVSGVIDDDVDGLLVKPGDRNGLADAILRLKNDAKLRASLSASGRSKVLQRYTLEKINRGTYDFLIDRAGLTIGDFSG